MSVHITTGFTPEEGRMRLVIGENNSTYGVNLNLQELNQLIEIASKMKILVMEETRNQDEPEYE